jgi:hypothetical protein
MRMMPLVKGLLTFIPGARRASTLRIGSKVPASYCYGVWLKHLTLLNANGMSRVPSSVAELGPGTSLGVGLAALLSGAKCYYALDLATYANPEHDLRVLNDLVVLFKTRAPRPTKGWPDYDEYLDDGLFPSGILTDAVLEQSLSDERVGAIRNAISNPGSRVEDVSVKYAVPWSDSDVIERSSIDAVLSHSVLQYVVDLKGTYEALHHWLKPQGMMSHQIDFSSIGLSETWNGHRAYSEMYWRLVTGRRPFFINREPPSVHTRLMIENDFEVVCDLRNDRADGLTKADASPRWKNMTDEDFRCSGAFIQAKK